MEVNAYNLDSLRSDIMRGLLNTIGRDEIWKYDIISPKQALNDAVYNQSYDSMQAYSDHKQHQFALVGYGIEDSYFSTPTELADILLWLCYQDGYLACYRAVTDNITATSICNNCIAEFQQPEVIT